MRLAFCAETWVDNTKFTKTINKLKMVFYWITNAMENNHTYRGEVWGEEMKVLKRRLPEDPATEHRLEGGDRGERPRGYLGQGSQPQRC